MKFSTNCKDGTIFTADLDGRNEILTVQGIQYAFSLFNSLGFGKEGTRFEVVKRNDGVVELKEIGK